jgi:hypothetical protein
MVGEGVKRSDGSWTPIRIEPVVLGPVDASVLAVKMQAEWAGSQSALGAALPEPTVWRGSARPGWFGWGLDPTAMYALPAGSLRSAFGAAPGFG